MISDAQSPSESMFFFAMRMEWSKKGGCYEGQSIIKYEHLSNSTSSFAIDT